jgi:hypothetical protein
MQQLTLDDAADFLDAATIEYTIDHGSVITHLGNIGTASEPIPFVFTNDMFGTTVVMVGSGAASADFQDVKACK